MPTTAQAQPRHADGLAYDGAQTTVTGVLGTMSIRRNRADAPWAHGRIQLDDPDLRIPFVIYPQAYAAGDVAAALPDLLGDADLRVRLTGRMDRRDGRPLVIVTTIEEEATHG